MFVNRPTSIHNNENVPTPSNLHRHSRTGGGGGGGLKARNINHDENNQSIINFPKTPLRSSSASASNTAKSLTQTNGKSTTSKRRVLGDISNRKNTNHNTGAGTGKLKIHGGGKSSSTTVQTRPKQTNNNKTNRKKKHGGGLFVTFDETQQTQNQTQSSSFLTTSRKQLDKASSSSTTLLGSSSSLASSSSLTSSLKAQQGNPTSFKIHSSISSKKKNQMGKNHDYVEDVELSSGRTWKEEQELHYQHKDYTYNNNNNNNNDEFLKDDWDPIQELKTIEQNQIEYVSRDEEEKRIDQLYKKEYDLKMNDFYKDTHLEGFEPEVKAHIDSLEDDLMNMHLSDELLDSKERMTRHDDDDYLSFLNKNDDDDSIISF